MACDLLGGGLLTGQHDLDRVARRQRHHHEDDDADAEQDRHELGEYDRRAPRVLKLSPLSGRRGDESVYAGVVQVDPAVGAGLPAADAFRDAIDILRQPHEDPGGILVHDRLGLLVEFRALGLV